MINLSERQKDILSIIDSIDITPTMYMNAVDKYNAIIKYLNSSDIKAEMYPQGSFAFGTVVRPNAKDPSASYDLDFICQVAGNREDYSPSELRHKIEEALTSSNRYGGKLTVCEECFTVEYADTNGVGFKIDVVPATGESEGNKLILTKKCIEKNLSANLIDTAIVIPKHNGERNYSWLTNNPKGFLTWFNEINDHFLAVSASTYRQKLFEENTSLFSSVEEIPYELNRSSLQRVIQILKYHRNAYYAKVNDGDYLKPNSAIINVAVARIASRYKYDCSVFELLEHVLKELDIYSSLGNYSHKDSNHLHENLVMSRQDGKWYIPNPANPEDNLADRWNEDKRIPEYFFKWLKVVKTDLIDSLFLENDQQFRTAIENGLGSLSVSKVLNSKYCSNNNAKPIHYESSPKPYLNL